MTAKEYLRQIAVLDTKIKRRQTEIEELKTAATHITTTLDENKIQSSSGRADDKIANIVTRWITMEHQVAEMLDQLMNLRHKIIGEIHQLTDDRYIRILEMRYVDRETFEQIAVNMQYDIRWVYRLHGFALQEFAKKHLTSESHD